MAAVLGGCRPRGILSSDEMREVLVDLHKTDALLQLSGLGMQDQEAKQIYYAQVLERHGVTQAQFDSSLVWYTAHPQLFNKIYPKVMADLEAEEKAYASQLEIEMNAAPQKMVWNGSFDTTYVTLIEGVYPTLRPYAPSVHDTIDQLLP